MVTGVARNRTDPEILARSAFWIWMLNRSFRNNVIQEHYKIYTSIVFLGGKGSKLLNFCIRFFVNLFLKRMLKSCMLSASSLFFFSVMVTVDSIPIEAK
jgi:hypothetical protein